MASAVRRARAGREGGDAAAAGGGSPTAGRGGRRSRCCGRRRCRRRRRPGRRARPTGWARSASRSRRSTTESSWASGPIGREAVTRTPSWAAFSSATSGGHLLLGVEGVGEQQRDDHDLAPPRWRPAWRRRRGRVGCDTSRKATCDVEGRDGGRAGPWRICRLTSGVRGSWLPGPSSTSVGAVMRLLRFCGVVRSGRGGSVVGSGGGRRRRGCAGSSAGHAGAERPAVRLVDEDERAGRRGAPGRGRPAAGRPARAGPVRCR